MSKCDFTISVGNQIDEPKKLLKNELAKRGGHVSFNDNGHEGKFDIEITGIGKVSGNLTIRDGEIHIAITQKPLLLPCRTIKSFINNYLWV
jgi:hypothetical protein